jgi:bacitracin synthase 3
MVKKISNNNIESVCGLTPMQQGMLYHKMLNESSTEYVLQDTFVFRGKMDDEYFAQSIDLICFKYEVLRTVFMYKKALIPRQIVLKERKSEVTIIDLSECKPDVLQKEQEKIKEQDIKRGFDLEKDNLFRAILIKVTRDESIILFTSHHIIIDGWCNSILFKDFIDNYKSLLSGISFEVLKERAHKSKNSISKYCDYVKWIEGKEHKTGIDYFKKLLEGYDNSDKIRTACNKKSDKKNINIAERVIDTAIYDNLLLLAGNLNITINTLFETAWGILLQKYTKSSDVVFGKVVSGRNADINGIEKMVGLFINTIPVRVECDKDIPVEDLLRKQQRQSLESAEYDYCALMDIQKTTHLLSGLFHTLFVFENYYIDEAFKNGSGTDNMKWSNSREETNYPITITVFCSEEVTVSIMFDTSKYELLEIEGLLTQYEILLESIVKNSKTIVKNLDILDENNKEMILHSFNNTMTNYKDNKLTVLELYEKQVLKNPLHKALTFGENQLSYGEFYQKVNTLAAKLRKLGVKPNDFVVIIAERSMEMIIGIYAILKAGGAYVPVDSSYPQSRIDYILRDCNPKAILLYKVSLHTQHITIDLESAEVFLGNFEDVKNVNKPDDYCYCIYTSGTTGQPKGVINLHSGLSNLLLFMQDKYPLTSKDVILQKTTYVFDVSASEIFWWSTVGASLAILNPQEEKDADAIISSIERYGVTLIDFVPSMLSAFIMSLEDNKIYKSDISSLKYVISAGEALNEELVNKFYKLTEVWKQNIKLINLYGPTEASIYTTYYDCVKGMGTVPIGKPISNMQIYIMNDEKLCPIGVPGELCIAGKGLAAGYLNKEELTMEKFIDNPFGPGKMYRSGDLARWYYDGNIDYQGRLDEQVKIRGFRIELGEIENAIRRDPQVKDVAVITKNDKSGDKAIYAYIVSEDELDIRMLSNHLYEQLPPYMVPAFITRIEQIPITKNGKLDKRALPDIDNLNKKEYISPKTEAEIVLCDILGKILDVDKIGINDNFFELGGDSIKAIRVVSKLREAGYEMSVKNVMDKYTIEIMAKTLKISMAENYSREEVTGTVIKTPIIKEYDNWNMKKPEHFNQSVILKVTGQKIEHVKQILTALTTHHDMLRAVYKENKLTVLSSKQSRLFDFYEYDCMNEEEVKERIEQTCNHIQGEMDLEQGPLLKAAIFNCSKNDYLLLCIHHLVIDGISWRILLEDYENASNQLKEGTGIRFQDKTVSFLTWAQYLQEYKESSEFLKEQNYWYKILPRMRNINYEEISSKLSGGAGEIDINFDETSTKKILKDANKAFFTSINDLLLSALALSIYHVIGNEEAVVFLEGHGREELHKQINIDRTVGWFTNIYPVLLQCDLDLRESIIRTKEYLRKVPNHGLGYGLLPQEEKNIPALFYFNFLGENNEDKNGLQVFDISSGLDSAIENLLAEKIFINGIVVKDKLHFNFSFDKSRYDEQFIIKFAEIFQAKLNNVCDYCIKQSETTKTASDYSALDLSQRDLKYIIDFYHSHCESVEDIYSLTPLQEGILFHSRMDGQATGYLVQNVLEVSDNILEDTVASILKILTYKYEVLKTSIIFNGLEKPRQVILKNRQIDYELYDFSHLEELSDSKLNELIRADADRGFDLVEDSLIRVKYIKLANNKPKMIWTYNHIIMDGWCTGLLFGDFMRYYNMILRGVLGSEALKSIDEEKKAFARYSHYVNYLENTDQKESLNYWKDVLAGYDDSIGIQPMHKSIESTNQIAKESIIISDRIVKLLIEKTAKYSVTLNSIVEAAWGVLLQKNNFTDDVVFGKVVSGRNVPLQGVENILGLFINTIPIRVTNNNITVHNLVQNIQHQALEGSNHQYCSLADIQSITSQGKELIKTLLVFENYYIDKEKIKKHKSDVQIKVDSVHEQTNYDLTLSVALEHSKLDCEILYNPNQYKAFEINLLLIRLEKILYGFGHQWMENVSNLDFVTDYEKQMIFEEFNNTERPYEKHKTVVDFLEEQCSKYPDHIAVCYEENNITYQQLKEKSDYLAVKLRKLGVKSNDFVAILTKKSIEMIIGLCAIIKAGGAYVPIDIKYPKDRVNYILKDCLPKAVLIYGVQLQIDDSFPVIDLANQENILGTQEQLQFITKANDLIYMIYTSGSTGNPKGVMIEHKSVVNLVKNDKCVDFGTHTIMLQTGALAFDVSTYEIWGVLLHGGTLHLIHEDNLLNYDIVKKYIRYSKINTMFLTTALFHQFVQSEPSVFDELKYLVFGGEKAADECVNKLRNRGFNYDLINAYGPTETTTFATYYLVEHNKLSIPIGKPLLNVNAYVMNGTQLCGIGAFGELCIAGDGVARGYLNRDELTKEKFINNPYGEGKLYRTGDLVRWLDDGNIEYIDRIDQQVKIRGFRIELAEIETNIRKSIRIKDVVVVIKEQIGEKAICAYLVSDEALVINDIRNKLLQSMPDYMMPSYMVQIDKIPLTTNGKLDKKALPTIGLKSTYEYEVPANHIEEIICGIFIEILGMKQVGRNDNFFELGGHSLRATRLINRLEEETGVRIPLKEVFMYPTVSELAKRVNLKEANKYTPIPLANEQEYYDMSSTQKRIYLINQIELNSLVYNLQIAFWLNGMIHVERLEHALEIMLGRHEILRTEFLLKEGRMVQRIRADIKVDFKYIQESEKTETELLGEFVKPFDLEMAPLLRVLLVQKGDKYLFCLDIHHIISDGMSIGNFMRELSDLYNNELSNHDIRQYKDYSEWMKKVNLEEQKKYWIRTFTDEIPVLDIPTDYIRSKKQSFLGSMVGVILNVELSEKIKRMAKTAGATEYMVFLSAAMILLSKYSHQEDIIIGSPVSARTHKDTEKMLGMFVNTLAMRGKPQNNIRYKDFLNEIKDICLKAYENQEYPFEELIEEINLIRDLSRNPLFDVMLALQNNEQPRCFFGEVEAEYINQNTSVAKFDLTFNICEENHSFEVMLEYCTELFTEETIKRMLSHYTEILNQITSMPDILIGMIEMISKEETQKILFDFNNTFSDYERDKTVVDLLEEQCNKSPEKIAVCFEDELLSYRKLKEKSDALAKHLQKLGVKTGEFVAIISEKSIEMIVGICGIIKAGGAYVPIDTKYPEERVRYILNDCNPKVILTYQAEIETKRLKVDLSAPQVWNTNLDEFVSDLLPLDLIYAIYTSGTTGNPKGTLVEHRNVIKLVKNVDYIELDENSIILQTGALAFDASTFEIWGSLLNGGTLHLLPEEKLLNTVALKEEIQIKNINTMFLTTSLFNQMVQNAPDIFDSVTYLLFGGEKASEDCVQILQNRKSVRNLINVYGPTETTTFTTAYKIKTDSKKILIGRPISNTQVYVMNQMQLCGIGVKGELCIAGDGVSRGYLNQDTLSKDKFIQNPYGAGKLYRTGDLARWNEEGDLEYIGRDDEQVKIRGFRIELAEIESHIRKHLKVKDVAVIVREDNTGKAIHAYLVSNEILHMNQIREELGKELPDYMIPSYMMQIDKLPLNGSNKLDIKSLPVIEKKSEKKYEKPRNSVELLLSEIFKEILGIDRVGIKDSFFELGGDSIKAIRIVSKMREAGYEITVKEIMRRYTVEGIALAVTLFERTHYRQDEVTGVVKEMPILRIFANWKLKKPEHFNQAVMIPVTTNNHAVLRRVFNKITQHHDILRAIYINNQLEILPVSKSKLYDFGNYDLRNLIDCRKEIEEIATRQQESINLLEGPLMKLVLFTTDEGNFLMIAIHHLIIDGVSWRILLEDIQTLIKQENEGKPLVLPAKTASIIDWANTIEEYAGSNSFEKEKQYWDKVIAKINQIKSKSNCIHNDDEQVFHYGNIEVTFDEEDTNQLLYDSSEAFHTEINDLLISALAKSISNALQNKEVVIGLEGHGREELHKKVDIDRTIGWFTSMYPIVVSSENSLDNHIISVKEMIRKIPNHGLGYGMLHQQEMQVDVYFNYLGHMDSEDNGLNVTDYSVGKSVADENRMPGDINFNGSINRNQLNFTITYNIDKYSSEIMLRIVEDFKNTLLEITEYCSSRTECIVTISDVDDEDLGDEDLDIINLLMSSEK